MDDLKLVIEQDAITTKQMLKIMSLQGKLTAEGSDTAALMNEIIEIIGGAVTSIEYKGASIDSLYDVPFRLLKQAIQTIMSGLTSTDPN